MASINGLEVKGVKYFPDHDGALIPYGNLYLNGKKVGSFRDDSWGGPMQYDHTHKTITEDEILKVCEKIYARFNWHEFYHDFPLLIHHLIGFKELESQFKKALKQERVLLSYEADKTQDPMKTRLMFVDKAFYALPNMTQKQLKEFEEEQQEKQSGGKMVVYRSLEDFKL
ncbi:hypothetical protein [Peribacillus asahii]|uniref:hypothetical protein n=1 Tax=Peribacillus asahii TaxID=228899 RepID=UPI00207A828B|nr:hypothetical protein [Peribacillus asahii]USK62248.1 hypothetical protein LIT37_24040 [Peribacillus asahii]